MPRDMKDTMFAGTAVRPMAAAARNSVTAMVCSSRCTARYMKNLCSAAVCHVVAVAAACCAVSRRLCHRASGKSGLVGTVVAELGAENKKDASLARRVQVNYFWLRSVISSDTPGHAVSAVCNRGEMDSAHVNSPARHHLSS